ncbi:MULTISPECIES: helix-turn-helix domain-containing protein [Pseudomonas]|uniref:Helix-turn-helix transcriptional regulator n=1 Tax=Pseudomonas lactucae TaxID=2813360 RepID=A0A9X0Y928_9PSED|nr:helix-turn-helix transcriptional regulator [Pseudomonas lactucae]MBN2975640.1 helix-turn-helix transcriptional regulator [Pseudomonas lactucae]MBN2989155.1 helix-turn-helix transcriptional regulator [Pseudomonas lactucae]
MTHEHSDEAAMNIGENIRNKRALKKVSQKIVAEAVGVAENTVASWEKGKNLPPPDKVIALAKYFKCTTDEILLSDEERGLEIQMLGLLRRFGSLNETHKPIALNVIGSILQGLEMEEYMKGERNEGSKRLGVLGD